MRLNIIISNCYKNYPLLLLDNLSTFLNDTANFRYKLLNNPAAIKSINTNQSIINYCELFIYKFGKKWKYTFNNMPRNRIRLHARFFFPLTPEIIPFPVWYGNNMHKKKDKNWKRFFIYFSFVSWKIDKL